MSDIERLLDEVRRLTGTDEVDDRGFLSVPVTLAEVGVRLEELERRVAAQETYVAHHARLERKDADATGSALDELHARVRSLEDDVRRAGGEDDELRELTERNVLDLLARAGDDLSLADCAERIASRHAEAVRGTAAEVAHLRRELADAREARAVLDVVDDVDDLRRELAGRTAERDRLVRALDLLARQYLRQTRQRDVAPEVLVESVLARVDVRGERADHVVGTVGAFARLVAALAPEGDRGRPGWPLAPGASRSDLATAWKSARVALDLEPLERYDRLDLERATVELLERLDRALATAVAATEATAASSEVRRAREAVAVALAARTGARASAEREPGGGGRAAP
jgi:hypothetical protein